MFAFAPSRNDSSAKPCQMPPSSPRLTSIRSLPVRTPTNTSRYASSSLIRSPADRDHASTLNPKGSIAGAVANPSQSPSDSPMFKRSIGAAFGPSAKSRSGQPSALKSATKTSRVRVMVSIAGANSMVCSVSTPSTFMSKVLRAPCPVLLSRAILRPIAMSMSPS